MSLFGPYSVVSDATTHDPLGYKIVTGTFDFVDDHMQGKSSKMNNNFSSTN